LLAVGVWRRRPAPGAAPLTILTVAIGVWCLAYALELRSSSEAAKVFWAKARYVGIAPVPLAWLTFAAQYTRRAAWLAPRSMALLAIVPLGTVLIALSSDAHRWLWQSLVFEPGSPALIRTPGPWYWVRVGYSYALFLLATFLIARALFRTRRPFRPQNVALLIGSLVPFLANSLYVSGVVPLGGLDLTPLGLGLAAVAFTWGLLRAHLLDLIPVARGAAIEGMSDGVLVLDSQSRVVDLNPAAERIIGWPADQAIGLPLVLALPEARHLVRSSEEGWVERMEIAAQRGAPDRWHELRTSVLRDDHQRPIGHLVLLQDVTERKANERSLAEARDQALQAGRAKSEFLATISHEIRTPMNAIIGMTDILLDSPLDDAQRECGQRVRAAAVHLLTILNDILDFSKVEAGKLEIEQHDFDLAQTIEEAVDLLAEKAQAKGLELVCRIDETVPTRVAGDAGRLRQMLLNLLTNAVKFTDRGEVVVKTSLVERQEGHSLVRVEVRDTGIGIPSAAQSHVFDSFSQVDASTTSRYGGTGLGLAIVKCFAQLMDGNVGVESQPGRGSTFWFTARLLDRPTQTVAANSSAAALRGCRVLCVDDNLSSSTQLQQILDGAGITTDVARDGEEGLRRLRQAAEQHRPYRVALLDLDMPALSGLAVARQVSSEPSLAGTSIVLLSPFAFFHEHPEDVRRWTVATLRKPVHRTALLALLSSLLAREPQEPTLRAGTSSSGV